MSTSWASYPAGYRSLEVSALATAVQHGECAAVIGLSGAGKSNLLGFLANRPGLGLPLAFVDCNRLSPPDADAFWRLIRRSLDGVSSPQPLDEFDALESSLARRLIVPESRFCLLFDRFDALPADLHPLVFSRLRALRDDHKYALTYIIAARQPVDPHSELAELFFAHTLWLGPLAPEDALWSAGGYAARAGLAWDEAIFSCLLQLSGGYPALLRASCEAYAAGCPLEPGALRAHPAVRRRLDEFWSADPSPEELALSRLESIPLLVKPSTPPGGTPGSIDTSQLTAKELRLWQALQTQAGAVCEKDDLIRSVWPEDKVYIEGIRDDALAQLVRRLRQKIRLQNGNAARIQTVPGRGYKINPGKK
jgi:hypothetical protein